MCVLFYGNADQPVSRYFFQMVEQQIQGEAVERYTTLPGLVERLRRFGKTPLLAVLVTGSLQELSAFVSIRHLLSGMRLILVLPDHSAETVSVGHRLHPRFVSFADSRGNEIAAVAARMLATARQESSRFRRDPAAEPQDLAARNTPLSVKRPKRFYQTQHKGGQA